MEAAARPFPREETTPPVTKMNFGVVPAAVNVSVCVPCAEECCSPAGAELKYALLSGAQSSMSTAEVTCDSYLVNGAGCFRRLPAGCACRITSHYSPVANHQSLLQYRFHTRHIAGMIHAHRVVRRFDHVDAVAVFEKAQLFELFQALQPAGRQRGKGQ